MKSKQKIVKVATLKKHIARLRKSKKIAFTNGCFDIVHYGHVSYLESAKGKDRVLIVGLNSDRSVKKIKGLKRPIIGQEARARLLAALSCIDFVVLFDEETPAKLIDSLKPDILIKGADWKGKKVVGADTVKTHGGKVELIRYIPRFSTTNIIKEVIRKCKK